VRPTKRQALVATLLESSIAAAIVAVVLIVMITAPGIVLAGDRTHRFETAHSVMQLAQSNRQGQQGTAPSRDEVVRAAKKRMPGSKVLKVERVDKGGSARYRARVLTPDGKVKVINISAGDL
jgi:uncharacterized membrane protein YkoI